MSDLHAERAGECSADVIGNFSALRSFYIYK
jgi:hypothetical protein